jgi:16S rRNA (adenine1518-N6/adenine1519-N6)-dimethyltransferase
MMHRRGARESKIKNPKSKIKKHHPKLGQHFLHDPRYRTRIIEALPLRAGEVVFEIGPGKGAMTALLAERARKVIAIEVDSALVGKLQEDFGDDPRLQIIQADVLRVDFAALCGQEGIAQSLVFGNLPYYITSPILHHLFAHRGCIRAMGLLMQREVAERLTAQPGNRDYGYLTVATQLYSHPQIEFVVPPGAFSPPPKVQSALVTLQMRPHFPDWTQEKSERFLDFAKRCFAQKRKSLLNNLASIYSRSEVLSALAGGHFAQNLRAEQLPLEDLAVLFEDLIHPRPPAASRHAP